MINSLVKELLDKVDDKCFEKSLKVVSILRLGKIFSR